VGKGGGVVNANQEAAALIIKLRRRRGLVAEPAPATDTAADLLDAEQVDAERVVQDKRQSLQRLEAAFVEFQTGTAFLPRQLRDEVNTFEGNFSYWVKALKKAFERRR